MFRIALLSKWHPHTGRYVPEILAADDCRVACVWDEIEERGKQWAQELNVPFVKNLNDVLIDKNIDGICVTAPTVMHKDIIIAAAKAGKHIFTEKALALTEHDALEIKDAVKRSGVKFGIAYIRRATGDCIFAKKLIDDGVLGEITMIRIRNNSPSGCTGRLNREMNYWLDPLQTGGGAMTDLGCHQMYLFDWMFGEPVTVSSTYSFCLNRPAEDSAISVFTFNQGRTIAIAESSFMTIYTPTYQFEVHGTKGTFTSNLDNSGCEVKLGAKVKPWFANEENVTRTESGEYATYKFAKSALPDTCSPLRQWINACTKGGEVEFDIDSAVRLTRMVEGANISHKEGKTYYFRPLAG